MKLRWITSSKDPILKRDGELILFVRETNDQTLNVLNATKAALPHVVCRSLRYNIAEDREKAIDLTILRRLASEIGPHAESLLQRQILLPDFAAGKEIGRLYGELVELDNHGLFVTMLPVSNTRTN